MKAYIKFLLILLAISVLVGTITKITAPHLRERTEPVRIPTYSEVVPADFSASRISTVVDVREAGALLEPRLATVKIADDIIAIACPQRRQECIIKALSRWVSTQIEYQDALLARDAILSPGETIIYRQADGVTKSILLAALLRGEGIHTRLAWTPYSQFVETEDGIRIDSACVRCRYGTVRYDGPEENIVWVS